MENVEEVYKEIVKGIMFIVCLGLFVLICLGLFIMVLGLAGCGPNQAYVLPVTSLPACGD